MATNPWSILGVPPGSDETTVKKAYRALSLKHHPDRGGDADAFIKVQDAYNKIISGDTGFGNFMFSYENPNYKVTHTSLFTFKVEKVG